MGGYERILERLREIVDRRCRHGAGKDLEPFGGVALAKLTIEHFGQQLALSQAVGEPAKPRVVAPFRAAELVAQRRPELLLVAHQVNPAVASAVELARRERRMRRARQAPRDDAFV